MLVSNCPERPTNGSPWMSSSAPGASPINIRSALGFPTPKTICLRPCLCRRTACTVAKVFPNHPQRLPRIPPAKSVPQQNGKQHPRGGASAIYLFLPDGHRVGIGSLKILPLSITREAASRAQHGGNARRGKRQIKIIDAKTHCRQRMARSAVKRLPEFRGRQGKPVTTAKQNSTRLHGQLGGGNYLVPALAAQLPTCWSLVLPQFRRCAIMVTALRSESNPTPFPRDVIYYNRVKASLEASFFRAFSRAFWCLGRRSPQSICDRLLPPQLGQNVLRRLKFQRQRIQFASFFWSRRIFSWDDNPPPPPS